MRGGVKMYMFWKRIKEGWVGWEVMMVGGVGRE